MDLFSEDARRQAREIISRLSPEHPSEVNELMTVGPEGKPIWEEWADRGLFDTRGRLIEIQSVGRNITERKLAEIELQRLSTAIENATEEIIITDTEGRIQYVNPAFEKLTGYSRTEAIGKNPRFLRSGHHDAEFYRQFWETILSGKVWTGEMTNRKKDGSLVIQEGNISPIRGADEEVVGFVSIKRDVTERERLREQLLQAQKMEAIGTLASGIAHDFNNILTAIMGNADIALLTDLGPDHPARRSVEKISLAAGRAARLVNQILTFSRTKSQALASVDFAAVAREVVNLLQSTLPSTIEIHINIATERTKILADPVQCQQILMNLGTNAAHAMRHTGGKLVFDLQDVLLDNDSAAHYDNLEPGDYLRIDVSDTGEGMTLGVQDRIFEPYFTTKDSGEGTGLGLAVVHGIVTKVNGAIAVKSAPGKGSRFRLLFPATGSVAGPPAAPQGTRDDNGHGRSDRYR
jgi:PAS domain S-box-containing protein